MGSFQVTIPGEPLGMERPRAAVVAGKPRLYTPKKSAGWKATAQAHMALEMKKRGMKPFAGAVRVDVMAVFALPRSKWKKRHPVAAGLPVTKKPDWDNIGKIVCDSANGIVWLDDAQISVGRVEKCYAAQGEPGMVQLLVVEIER